MARNSLQIGQIVFKQGSSRTFGIITGSRPAQQPARNWQTLSPDDVEYHIEWVRKNKVVKEWTHGVWLCDAKNEVAYLAERVVKAKVRANNAAERLKNIVAKFPQYQPKT